MERLREQDFRCAQSGLELHLTCPDTGDSRNPWSPSLDRKDRTQGYTPENVQIVCMMYNVAKASFSDDHVAMMAYAIAENYQQC